MTSTLLGKAAIALLPSCHHRPQPFAASQQHLSIPKHQASGELPEKPVFVAASGVSHAALASCARLTIPLLHLLPAFRIAQVQSKSQASSALAPASADTVRACVSPRSYRQTVTSAASPLPVGPEAPIDGQLSLILRPICTTICALSLLHSSPFTPFSPFPPVRCCICRSLVTRDCWTGTAVNWTNTLAPFWCDLLARLGPKFTGCFEPVPWRAPDGI